MNRVAVTTTTDTAPRVCEALERCGLEGVGLPCIRIEPSPSVILDRLRDAATTSEWLVFTSARAIRILWPDGPMPSTKAACVGAATAAEVERREGRVVYVGSGGASALVDAIEADLAGDSVVFARARAGDVSVVDRLRVVAGTLVSDPAYDTIPTAPDPEPPVDAVIFGSPSAYVGWSLTRGLNNTVVAAMGSTTATALTDAGHPPDVIPDTPGFDPLAAALATYLGYHGAMRPTPNTMRSST
jgi:uroporphyrinogen-III synthase